MASIHPARIVATLSLFLLLGCSARLADLNAISTRPINPNPVDLDSLDAQVVKGESTAFIFLFIPFGSPNLHDAVEDALEKGNGDLMTDVVVNRSSWWFLFGQSKLSVTGTVVNTKQGN